MALDLERKEHRVCQAHFIESMAMANILYNKLNEEYERNDVLAEGLQRLRKDLNSCQETIKKLCHNLYEKLQVRQDMRSQHWTSTQSRCTSESHIGFDLEDNVKQLRVATQHLKAQDPSKVKILLWSDHKTVLCALTGSTCT